MIKLLRYFSITSLIAIVSVAAMLGLFYRQVAVDDLVKLGESKNVALTRAFANSLWSEVAPLLDSDSSLSADELRARPETTELLQAVTEQMDGLSVIKVKIYNLDGLTVFSTEASQIGDDKSANEGFLSAVSGQAVSELTHRDTFSAFEGMIEDRDVISSYVPIQLGGNTNPIMGVFEVYDDVTPLLESIKVTQRSVTSGVALILALLYTVLFFIVKRAEGIINDYQLELKLRERELRKGQNALELRVAERTTDLREANDHLQLEIIQRQQVEDQLVHNANYDSLTNLPNRTMFIERLGRALERAKRRSSYMFAVLFLDLDGLKMINDSLGHSSGDQLLTEFARRLENILRPPDTIARFGGDEFTILLEDIEDISDTLRVADRVQEILALPFTQNGKELFSSVSIGIAMSVAGYDQPDDILRDADIAMYRAKSKGGGRHEVFNQSMHTKAVKRLQLETELHRAIEQEQFRVYYQPIVSLEDGKITAFEALVRWEHPERGLILPIEFIPIAEETGMIIDIDWIVMREACSQMSALQKESPASRSWLMTVDISVKHLSRKGFVEQIDQIIAETGLDPSSLGLEITESALIDDDETTISNLSKLNARGFQLHLDDFGTGYSSLGYLHRFSIDTLKIDRSFVGRIGVDGESSDIVHTVVKLAHNMGMRVIAEGIETEDQLAKLREFDCKYGQGFLFSKPVASLKMAVLAAEEVKV